MLCLETLAAKPAAFVSFTGLTPGQFHALADEFAPHYRRHRAAAAATRRGHQPRRPDTPCYASSVASRRRVLLRRLAIPSRSEQGRRGTPSCSPSVAGFHSRQHAPPSPALHRRPHRRHLPHRPDPTRPDPAGGPRA